MPTFRVVNTKTGEYVPWRDSGPHSLNDGMHLHKRGEPWECSNGKDAAAYAEYETMQTGIKHRPERVKGELGAWKKREAERFTLGLYDRVPWAKASWFKGTVGETEHFVHVSRDKPGMVAFIESDAKGDADIQTRIKPGVYLERFYSGSLSSRQIQDWARQFAGQHEENGLLFAKTAKEIRDVYENGPESCMSYEATRYYSKPHHPTEAYAGPDLAVAYIKRKGSNRVAARALCWPEQKRYSRVYGDDARLVPLLKKEGYKNATLAGAKMARIEVKHDGRSFLVMPYIDNAGRFMDCQTHLEIADGATIPRNGYKIYGAGATNGVVRIPNGLQCEWCGTDGFKADDGREYIDYPGHFCCNHCYPNTGYECRATKVRYARAHSIRPMRDANNRSYYWNVNHYEKHGIQCTISDHYFSKEDAVEIEQHDARRRPMWVGKPYVKDYVFQCSDCEKHFMKNHHHYGYSHNDPRCDRCEEARKKNGGKKPPKTGRDENTNQLELLAAEEAKQHRRKTGSSLKPTGSPYK